MTRTIEQIRSDLDDERRGLVEAAGALRGEMEHTLDLRSRLGGHPLLVVGGALLGLFVALTALRLAIAGLLRLAGRGVRAAAS